MKKVVQVKLTPSVDQARAMATTLHLCNLQANEVSRIARERDIRSKHDIQRVTYGQVRDSGLSSQAAILTIRKVAGAYATHRANLAAGNYGKKGSARRDAAQAKVITFRPDAAQPYDDRILSWNHTRRTVSIWVTDTGTGSPGRITVPFTGKAEHLRTLAAHRQGESDLIHPDGAWYLIATIDTPEVPVTDPSGFYGVDLGIVQIATLATDDGALVRDWSGGAVTARRKRNQRLRARLQAKGTKSAKRLLRNRSKKETRFVTDVNHQISKTIVAEAKRTGRGVAVENLTGIRDRVRHRKPQRATIHSWAFAQLGAFLAYKATAAAVPFTQVDPAYTSQTCSGCGVVDKKNRKNQATYTCACGASLNADHNAAINIARRGMDGWGASRDLLAA